MIARSFARWAAALSLLAGCASYETLDINRSHRAGNYVLSKEDSGLVAAAESYYESRKSEIHFWFDLRGEGFVPVVLHFDNLSDNGFVLTPDGISLFLKDGTELKTAPVVDVVEQCRYSFLPSLLCFPLLVFVGPFWNMAYRAQLNFDMEVDYRKKDLYLGRNAVRIPGNSHLEGAIFFRLSGRRDVDLTGAIVQLALTREKGAGDSASTRVDFRVPLE